MSRPVTFLLLMFGALYAASWCFVAVLLTRTLWRERKTPLNVTTIRHTQESSVSTLECPAVADALTATRSA